MKTAGFSLLESLIALAILSIGLLGFAEAQLLALQQDQQAYLQSLASQQLANMAERIHGCGINGVVAASCLNTELTRWRKENQQLFPQVDDKVITRGNHYQLSLQWKMPMRSSAVERQFVLTQEIIP